MISSTGHAKLFGRTGTSTSRAWPAAVEATQAILPASQNSLQQHLQQDALLNSSWHRPLVTASSHQRKRNPFVDIERDVLPDGKPNTPWRRLKLRIQQALSVQALITIFLNNHHKTNVWRPIHSAGIIMRLGALHYYRLLQNPRLTSDTSVKTLELLNLLAVDLTNPRVMHILDAARLSQVLVVLSAVNPRPSVNLIDPFVRELLRAGGKKLPMTKPDLLAELAAGLVRLGWWEQEVWLAVVAAAFEALQIQQQRWQQQQQTEQNEEIQQDMMQGMDWGTTWAAGEQQQQQDVLLEQVPWLEQQQQQDQEEIWQQEMHHEQQQQQWQDPSEDEYVRWEQQQWEQWQQQQELQALADVPDLQQQQQQQPLQLDAQTEFQWEEEQQQGEQQEWLEEQHWYDGSWQQQQQQLDLETEWLMSPEDQQYQEEEQQDEQQQEAFLANSSSSSRFGPHWLSADFPKLAAALAAAAAAFEHQQQQQSVSQDALVHNSLTLRSSIEQAMELLGTLAVRYLVLLPPAELADLSGAYARLGLRHHELLTGLNSTLIEKVQYMASSLSPSRIWQQQQQQQQRVVKDAESAEPAAAESDLAAVIRAADGLCQLGYADQALVEAVQDLVLYCNGGSSSSSTGSVAGLTVGQLVQLLQLVALPSSSSSSSSGIAQLSKLVCNAIAAGGLDALTSEQLRAAAAALVELQQQQQQLPEAGAAMSVIGAAATARAVECGPAVLSEVLWGCVMLGCYNELLAEVAVAAVEEFTSVPIKRKTKSRKQRQLAAAAAVSHGATQHGGKVQMHKSNSSSQTGQHSGQLTSKHQAQLLWVLQQLNRQDLVDRVLVTVQVGISDGSELLKEPGVPHF